MQIRVRNHFCLSSKSNFLGCFGLLFNLFLNIIKCNFCVAILLMQISKLSCPDKYQVISKLGQGSFGEVMLVQKKGTKGQLRALKRICKSQIVKFDKMHQVFIQRQILREFHHYKNNRCIDIFDTDSNEDYIFMILQYCQGGSLEKIIPDLAALDPKQKELLIPKISAKILLSLNQIHSKKVIHRDLKPSNLLITKQGDIKLADFGSSYAPSEFYKPEAWEKIQNIKKAMNQKKQRKISEDSTQTIQINSVVRKASFVGTPYYMAPELLTEDICQIEADLWAYGCIVYQLVNGRPLFYDSNEGIVWKKIINQDFSIKMDSQKNVPYLKDFLEAILKKNRNQRLGAKSLNHQEIKKHPFFGKVNWAQIQLGPIPQLIALFEKKQSPVMKKKSHTSTDVTIKKVLFSGMVLKKMFFGNFKQRMLVLNSSPQLIYYDPDSGQQKGQIILKKNINIGLDGNKHFAITNQKKTYYFKSAKAHEWVQMMKNAIQAAYY